MTATIAMTTPPPLPSTIIAPHPPQPQPQPPLHHTATVPPSLDHYCHYCRYCCKYYNNLIHKIVINLSPTF